MHVPEESLHSEVLQIEHPYGGLAMQFPFESSHVWESIFTQYPLLFLQYLEGVQVNCI
jgi:hypothetical protein